MTKLTLQRGIVLVALVAGCFAIPRLNTVDDISIFFDHPDAASRIVGGSEAPAGSASHMVALTSGLNLRMLICGGSLISTRTVLTAAHCIVSQFSGGNLSSSFLGTVGTNIWNSGGTTISFQRNVTHPHYVSSTIKNDIGLLITTAEVTLSDVTQPIPLSFNYMPGGIEVRATGWGRIVVGGWIPTQLQELYLTTIDGSQCVADVAQAAADLNMWPPIVEPHIELCTFHSVGHGMCHGDSGSALLRTDVLAQVGIVSWGFPCAVGAPDMFVRLSAFEEFIMTNAV